MIILVDSTGKPIPADAIHIGANIQFTEVTKGAYSLGVSGEDSEVTQVVTRNKYVTTYNVVTREESTRIIRPSAFRKALTVTRDRSVSRVFYATVTEYIGTLTNNRVIEKGEFDITVTRDSSATVPEYVTDYVTRDTSVTVTEYVTKVSATL